VHRKSIHVKNKKKHNNNVINRKILQIAKRAYLKDRKPLEMVP